jgi:hypothetical protein
MTNIARDPRAIAAAVIAAVVAGVAVGLASEDAGTGVFVGIAALGYAAFVAWEVARRRARSTLFRIYAARHALSEGGRGPLPAVTEVLRDDDRSPASTLPSSHVAERAVAGSLPGGIDGILAHYRWVVGSGADSTEMKATIVLTTVPEAAGFVRRVFFRELERSDHTQELGVESAALARPRAVMIGLEDDPNRARQLFSPTFLHWLERLPQDFSFEFDHGYLVCARRSRAQTAEELDWLCATTAKVAERFRSEALESPPTGHGQAASLDPGRALTPPHLDRAKSWAQLELGAAVLVYLAALGLILAVV